MGFMMGGAPRTPKPRHALVHNRASDAKALDVTPDDHGPHVRAVRALGDDVPALGHLHWSCEPSKIRQSSGELARSEPCGVGSQLVDAAEDLHAGAGGGVMSTLGFEPARYSRKRFRVSVYFKPKPTMMSTFGPLFHPRRTKRVPVPLAPPQSSATSS